MQHSYPTPQGAGSRRAQPPLTLRETEQEDNTERKTSGSQRASLARYHHVLELSGMGALETMPSRQ